jgi:PAS domain S-box-containing protein
MGPSAQLTPLEESALDIESALTADPQSLSTHADLRQRQRAVILAYCRRSVARGEPAKLMLDAASLISETLQATVRATVERVDSTDTWRLHLLLPDGGSESNEQLYCAEPKQSFAAFAIAAGRPVTCADLASETRFQDPFLLQSGIVSGLMLPLRLDGRTVGAIGVYSERRHEFSVDDVEFADTIAHMLVSAIARIETAAALDCSRRTLETVFETAESIVILADLEGRITRINRAGERLIGYTNDEIARRPLWEFAATDGEVQVAREKFRAGLESEQAVAYESDLQTKHGERRRIRWSQAAMLDEFATPRSMVLTGLDITGLERLEGELHDIRAAKQRVQEQLREQLSRGNSGSPAPRVEPAKTGEAGEHAGGDPFRLLGDSQHQQLRSSPRRSYPYRQSLAPIVDGKLPSKDEFVEVQFRDISAGGVSFLFDKRPQFSTLVLALGCPPNVHYVKGQIVNATETVNEGNKAFLVGCRFLERVHL